MNIKTLLNDYYEVAVKLTAATYVFQKKEKDMKNKGNYQELYERYLSNVEQLAVLYDKIRKIKEEQVIPMFDFTNYIDQDIVIQDGYLVGDIELAIAQAQKYLNENDGLKDVEQFLHYEIALFVMHYSSNRVFNKTPKKKEIDEAIPVFHQYNIKPNKPTSLFSFIY